MSYDVSSIESLTFREGVRRRVSMYLGSNDNEGTYQAFKEILNNSTDEALAGYGNRIEITVNLNKNEIALQDFGRGVPIGKNNQGEEVLIAIYTKAHTGGKFDKKSYKNSSGLNGIGGSCVCLSSSEFEVISRRDGKKARAYFEKGNLVNYNEENEPRQKETGTYVRFIPDPEVFSNEEIGYSYERLCEEIRNISYLYPGIEFVVKGILDDIVEQQTFCAKNGIIDFVKDLAEQPLHKTILTASVSGEEDSIEIAFQWTNKKEQSYVFVNGLLTPEGGTPITGAKTAITKTFNARSGDKIDGDKLREGLFYVINCKVANPSFANQTKTKISNASLRTLASNAFTQAIKAMPQEEFDKIAAVMRKIAKADEAAEKARAAILNHEKEMGKTKKHKVILSDKLNDAKNLGEDSILLVVEGESSGGNMVRGRQASKMNNIGILKLRGKCINPYTHELDKVLANEEVKLLCQALGITYGQKMNEKKLRYGKVAICVDAD